MMLAPIRRTLVRPFYPSGVELIQSDLGLWGMKATCGRHGRQWSLRAIRPDASIWLVPPCQQDERFSFSFRLINKQFSKIF